MSSDDSPEILLIMADSLYEIEEYYKAIPYYSRVLLIDSTVANAYFRRGNCFAYIQDYELSSLDYLKSIDLNWRLGDSYFNLASNFVLQGRSKDALEYFRRSYYYNPNDEFLKEQIELLELLYNN